ncbi:MAG TPA: asparagine synthase (glutamine-hydrolyzing) [Chloroflexota bacterium]|nr:asparagine synthase (glutamine-hydrolyzing) [Chloroflexota bacterium]HUM68062.1 asparagine synthase (glutamine-hydrolyzing) [Chloroflexota bacterium]
MCGICGIVGAGQPGQNELLKQMCHTLAHRGPDDEGFYADSETLLGMRRLAIIDLVTGHQPISNEDKNLWLVFNGEIYNYRTLRAELEQKGHLFITDSDSETIIHAYEEVGPDCVGRLNGMFAFAIWDAQKQSLFLARDHIGIKPLYYWHNGRTLIFASELKALITHPLVPRQISRAALDHFLTLEYIPSPLTIFQDVHKLPPGHWLRFQAGQIQIESFWKIKPQALPSDDNVCVEMLRDLIQDAVRSQLMSDVPLGAFLSGGIDSSTIVACMSQAMTLPVQTFSIGFGEATYNELPYARAMATQFNTQHTEEILTPDIGPLVEQLAAHLDEPLADFSIFPTYLVSKVAAQQVKVVLSGDGGDELFGGYDTYVAQQLDRYYRWLPATLRQRTIPSVVGRIPPQSAKKGTINKTKRFVEGAALPATWQHTRWMMFLPESDKGRLYTPEMQAGVNGLTAVATIERTFQQAAHLDPLSQQQYVDIKTYLADNILTKVDRMSMAVSLEARVPLLDHRIVEFALSLPPHLKIHRGQTKVILRRAMHGRLPDAILNKPKEGFSIPLKHWLGGTLRPLLTDLLSETSIRNRGYFQPETVRQWIDEHLDGRANHSHRLWSLMLFELWLQKNVDV